MVSLIYFRTFILRPQREAILSEPIIRWLTWVWIVQIVSGGLWLWIATAQMSDDSLLGVLDFGVMRTVLEQTQFGQLWFCRMGPALVQGIILVVAYRRNFLSCEKSLWLWIAIGLSLLLLISLAWAGHAASGTHDRTWHIGIDVFHLAIASVWPIGLIPLAVFLWTLPEFLPASELKYVILSLSRFSNTSVVAVTLLFLTGLTNAWFFIPSISALFTSTYGKLLLGKVILFSIMVGLGALNRFWHLPELEAVGSRISFIRLRKVVLIESMLGVIVLLIVGLMGMTAPP